MAIQRYTKAGLKRIGVRAFESIAVADPAGWFRGPWREPARALVEAAAARGLVEAGAARQLFEEHQRGVNHTRQLGVLVAVELFCRQVLDPATAGARSATKVVAA
jgi:hypothetical protein